MKHHIKSVSKLWVGSLAGAGLGFLTQVLLARALGPEDLGNFSSTLSNVMLLAPLAGFGVASFWLNIFGKEGFSAARWIQASFSFTLVSTLFTFLILLLWAIAGPHESKTQLLILILSSYILGQVCVELLNSKLQLEGRFGLMALWQCLPHLFRLLLTLLFIVTSAQGLTAQLAAYAYLLASLILILTSFGELLKMRRGQLKLEGHKETRSIENCSTTLKDVAISAWPFGLAAFSQLIYYQSNIVILKYLSGEEAAGIYSVAFTVMAAVYLFPNVLYQRFLMPKIHRWSNHDYAKFYKVYKYGNGAMLALGILAMIAIWATAWWLIPLLFGKSYSDSVYLVNILAISSPIMFTAFSTGSVLVTKDHMKKKVFYMAYVAIFNVAANFVCIPSLGPTGAAIATILSNALLLLLYSYGAQCHVFALRRAN
ncbi:Polysaccharide biosynthesis protein [compost metagenome]